MAWVLPLPFTQPTTQGGFYMKHSTLSLSGSLLAAATLLTGCLMQDESHSALQPSKESGKNELSSSASTAATLTWVQFCYSCIMPNLEFDLNNPTNDRTGWTFAFSYPVIPPKPLTWHTDGWAPATRADAAFTDIADMDNSVGELFMVQTSTGRITSLKGESMGNPVWHDLPVAVKGVQRIGVNAKRDIAILTKEVKPGGYGIQVYSPQTNSWQDIDGGAIDLDYDSNGDLWVVNNRAWAFSLPAGSRTWVGQGEFESSGAIAISAGGGRIVAITKVYGGKGNTLMQWGYHTWQPIPGQLDHLNIDAGGRLWGSNNESKSFYCQL
jgi:hypothetical protein